MKAAKTAPVNPNFHQPLSKYYYIQSNSDPVSIANFTEFAMSKACLRGDLKLRHGESFLRWKFH